jgi:hypothetical protein
MRITNGAADSRPTRQGYLGHRQPTCERLRMADEAYKSGKLEHPSLATCAFAHRVPLPDLLSLRHRSGNGHGNGHSKTLAEHPASASPELCEQLEQVKLVLTTLATTGELPNGQKLSDLSDDDFTAVLVTGLALSNTARSAFRDLWCRRQAAK